MAVLVFFAFAALAGILIATAMNRRPGTGYPQQRLQDAEAETRRWLDRLGTAVTSLPVYGNPAATQALTDAAERYNAASVQLAQARTTGQFTQASQTAIEGLHHIRAARTALDTDQTQPAQPTSEVN